ncbi:hypothetical protein Rhe02_07020 [Rhizocola hellebori]|uniref:HTH marR-type domain-containing protein n=1 Tax=Rhizocola hellebori TaxID=1392758 RepID=A0A8J3VDE2_9ACTN|nr:MarR family transcriptional regulator [Rhizocola hellebori]GIH02635.1 hypothetical protein Rhe02_07020 [Rhizocola hellebori]
MIQVMSATESLTAPRLRRVPSRLLAQAAGQADRLISAGLAQADAHKWHYAALATLHDVGSASQADLSRRTGIYRSDMVALLNELEERAYVRRSPDPQDKRRNIISITKRGEQQLSKLDKLVNALQDELLAGLSARDREHLVDLLARLVASFSAAGAGGQ